MEANKEIFNQFDSILSVTQKTINDQFENLTGKGLPIHPSFGLVQKVDSQQNYTYELIDKLPDDPQNSCFVGNILPKISILESGQAVLFNIQFTSGTAYFWEGLGRNAVLKSYDMTGWVYAANVNLDMKGLQLDEAGNNHQIMLPGNTENQQVLIDEKALEKLTEFEAKNYSINCLFANFENTKLWDTNVVASNAGESGDTGLKQLISFMSFYVRNLRKINNGNPYVFGYFPEVKPVSPNPNIPPILQACGVTYSCFKDKTADQSTLNYLLVTSGGKKTVPPGSFVFPENWIQTPDVHAKMIYSQHNILEKYIFRPLYTQLQNEVYSKIRSAVGAPIGNTYDQAVSQTPTGLHFLISNWRTEHEAYVNQFTVDFSQSEGKLYLTFKGLINLTAYDDVSVLFVKGSVTDVSATGWEKQVVISVQKDTTSKLLPQPDVLHFDTSQPAVITMKDHNRSFSGPMGELTKYLEKFLNVLDSVLHFLHLDFLDFLTNLFRDLFDLNTKNVSIDSIGAHLGSTTKNSIVLPGGKNFFIKSPNSYPYGALSTELTYKAIS